MSCRKENNVDGVCNESESEISQTNTLFVIPEKDIPTKL